MADKPCDRAPGRDRHLRGLRSGFSGHPACFMRGYPVFVELALPSALAHTPEDAVWSRQRGSECRAFLLFFFPGEISVLQGKILR